jgi:hypothetical protein
MPIDTSTMLDLTINITNKHVMQTVIDALEYKARNEAGQSQAPYLYAAEDTEEWSLAQQFKQILTAKSFLQRNTDKGASSW